MAEQDQAEFRPPLEPTTSEDDAAAARDVIGVAGAELALAQDAQARIAQLSEEHEAEIEKDELAAIGPVFETQTVRHLWTVGGPDPARAGALLGGTTLGGVSIVYSLRHQHTVARMMGQGVAATGVGCALGWMGGKALAPLIQKKPPPMSEEMPASAVADVLRALGGPIKPPAWRMKAWREAWARRAREFNSQNCAPSLLPAAMIQGATTTAVRGLLR